MLIGGARCLRWPFRSQHCMYECVPVCMCVFRARKEGVPDWWSLIVRVNSMPAWLLPSSLYSPWIKENQSHRHPSLGHPTFHLSPMAMAVYWVTAGLPINLITPWFRTTCVLFPLNELKGPRCYRFPTHTVDDTWVPRPNKLMTTQVLCILSS